MRDEPPATEGPGVHGFSAPSQPLQGRAADVELAVVLCLYFVPLLVTSIVDLVAPELRGAVGIGADALLLGLSSLQVAPAILYVMWRSGEPWCFFGLHRPRWRDPLLGVAIYSASLAAMIAVQTGLQPSTIFGFGFRAERSAMGSGRPDSAAEWVFIVLIALTNGGTEELAMRGYFLPRLEQRLRSGVAAVLLTSAMFAAYHIYQGPGALLPMFAFSLVLGCVFCATRRLWPLVFCHVLADIVPYALWPAG
jgi:uncharacterized protein